MLTYFLNWLLMNSFIFLVKIPAAAVSPGSAVENASNASTHSVASSSSSTPSVEADVPCKLKRSTESKPGTLKPKKLKLSTTDDDIIFNVPITMEVRRQVEKKQQLSDSQKNQLIRECVTCLSAACSMKGVKASAQHFEMAAKKICECVPMLKDQKPPSWPLDQPFTYWVRFY